MFLFYVLMSLGPCIVGASCYHGYQSPFSFNAHKAHHPSWMADIPDAINITSLSIPGTHDTMTYDIGRDDLQCQNWNLTIQMGAGLRYFDIRARLRDNELQIYHADGYTGHSYTDVLVAMFEFLDANPSETIIMRLKEEGSPIGDNNTITFEDAFLYAGSQNPLTKAGAAKHLMTYNTSQPIPTLGDVRSRIFMLQNFKATDDKNYSLTWEGPQMVLEDQWIVPDTDHLPDKWAAIQDGLERANSDPLDNQHIYLSHISASVGVLPIQAAAGPLNHTQVGMNDLTGKWVLDHYAAHTATRTGIVIFDFPGKKAIEAVLQWNKNVVKRLGL